MQLYTKTSNQKCGAGLSEAMANIMLKMENLKPEVEKRNINLPKFRTTTTVLLELTEREMRKHRRSVET